jgi:hypothetical protein
VILGAEEATIDPLQLLMVNAGVAGVVVVLILVGWLWAKPSVTREFDKSDERAKQQQVLLDTLLADYRTSLLPALLEVDKRVVPLMESTTVVLKRIEVLLDRVEREWDWRERRGREEETRFRRGGSDAGGDRGGGGEGPGAGDHPEGENRPRRA